MAPPRITPPVSVSSVKNDQFNGAEVVIYKGNVYDAVTAFSRISPIDGSLLEFTETGKFPAVFQDQNDMIWSVFGNGLSEANHGYRLQPTPGMAGYWFTFPAIYDSLEVENHGIVKSSSESSKRHSTDQLINPSRIFQGASKDGIPSIDNPVFIDYSDFNPDRREIVADETELYSVYKIDSIVYAIPHDILNWHEVVNHQIGDDFYTLSFCPLTGTTQLWKSDSEFGVSGLLYNSNLILYDRNTNSLWSQVLQLAISGERVEDTPERHHVFETNFDGLQLINVVEEIQIMTRETGFRRNYDQYPYGDYQNSSTVIFPLDYRSDLFHMKSRVFSVTDNCTAKVYLF